MFESKTYEVLVKSALSRVSSALDNRTADFAQPDDSGCGI